MPLAGLLAGLIALAPGAATAPRPPGPAATLLAPLVVSGTRRLAPSFDVPASVNSLARRRIARGQPQVNLSESLQSVPGVVAQNRQDYAQDLQISIRGFGALAPFGVQGIDLLLDGLPATFPDGQGQSQIFDLPAIERIEVLRGPFALAYGNTPGGVIRAFTADGTARPEFTARDWWGSDGATQAALGFGGPIGAAARYRGTLTRFATDGYRAHGAAERRQFYGKVNYQAGSTSLTFIADLFHQFALDPSSLTAAEAARDPAQANPRALLYDARKDVHHAEGGVAVDTVVGVADSVHVTAYAGTRSVEQFLPFTGDTGLSAGGVVALAAHFGGVRAHAIHQGSVGGLPYTLTAGVDYDRENEYRKGYANDYGTAGALRRNEFDVVDDVDEYLQGRLGLTPAWSFEGGVRHNLVRFGSQDFFVTPTNPDDGGGVDYSNVDPVLGTLYKLGPHLRLYANAGRGFQTPTFDELAYRPDGSPGLNLSLRAAVSDNYEAGVKALIGGALRIDAAVFHIDTHDEIVVAGSQNGRTSYENAAATRRDGAELRLTGSFAHHLSAVAALSYIDARFAAGADAGRRMPGVPGRVLYASLSWAPPVAGFYTTVEMQYRDRVYVDGANSAAAAPYAVVDWWAGLRQQPGRWRIEEFVRLDNLFDRRYVGAVVVGDANGRYFEPAPGRGYTVGVTVSTRI